MKISLIKFVRVWDLGRYTKSQFWSWVTSIWDLITTWKRTSEMSNKFLKIGMDLLLRNIGKPFSASFGAKKYSKSANFPRVWNFTAKQLFLFWKSRHAYTIAPIDAIFCMHTYKKLISEEIMNLYTKSYNVWYFWYLLLNKVWIVL